MATNNRDTGTGWIGWIYFAGFLMMVAGVLEMIAGLTALLNDSYYLVRNESLVIFDFTTWGWVHMLLGLVVLMAGSAVINGRTWGRVIAVILAMFSLITNFVFIAAYPIWSLIAITIDVLIIYALTVHGDEANL